MLSPNTASLHLSSSPLVHPGMGAPQGKSKINRTISKIRYYEQYYNIYDFLGLIQKDRITSWTLIKKKLTSIEDNNEQ